MASVSAPKCQSVVLSFAVNPLLVVDKTRRRKSFLCLWLVASPIALVASFLFISIRDNMVDGKRRDNFVSTLYNFVPVFEE